MNPSDRTETVALLSEAAVAFRALSRSRDVPPAERAYVEQRAAAAERMVVKLMAEANTK